MLGVCLIQEIMSFIKGVEVVQKNRFLSTYLSDFSDGKKYFVGKVCYIFQTWRPWMKEQKRFRPFSIIRYQMRAEKNKMLKNRLFKKDFFYLLKNLSNILAKIYFFWIPWTLFWVKTGLKIMISWIKQTRCKSECYSLLEQVKCTLF